MNTLRMQQIGVLVATFIVGCAAASPPPLWTIPNAVGLQKFHEARFGLFVHFGPVTQWGDEISFPLQCKSFPCDVQGPNRTTVKITNEQELAAHREAYAALAKTFNPSNIDLASMAELAWNAGMRYVTWVVVHCDGFSNFDSKLTTYKITNTPYGRDLFAEVKEAFSAKGHRVGAYYCPSLWNRNDYWYPNATTALGGCCSPSYLPHEQPGTWESFQSYLHGQLREIAENYQPTHFWIDSGSTLPSYDTRVEAVLPDMRKANPEVVVQVRGNGPFRDYSETSDHTETKVHSVFGSSTIATGPDRPFEVPMTIAQQWAYNPRASYKSPALILWDLLAVTSHGGNLLMNIGPGPDGLWAPAAVATLQGLSAWMTFGNEIVDGKLTEPVYPYEWTASGGNQSQWHFYCFYKNDGSALYVVGMSDPGSDADADAGRVTSDGVAAGAPAASASNILLPFVKPELLARNITGVSVLGAGSGGAPLPASHTLDASGLSVQYSLPAVPVPITQYWSQEREDQAPCALRDCSVYSSSGYQDEWEEGMLMARTTELATVPVYLWFRETGQHRGSDSMGPFRQRTEGKRADDGAASLDDNCYGLENTPPGNGSYTRYMLSGWTYPLSVSADDVAREVGLPVERPDGTVAHPHGGEGEHSGSESPLQLVPLSQYYSVERHDHFSLASDRSRSLAESQGYVHQGDLAMVLASKGGAVSAPAASASASGGGEVLGRLGDTRAELLRSAALGWAAAFRIDLA